MKLGSLCSGGGGLDLAVERVFAAETVWHAEVDPAASKVLAHRWPGVPNHGDLTNTDWSQVEPVDIMCAGWPCQPFSLAGKRKGADDERAIWPYVAGAIRLLRPRIVCLENVSAVIGSGELERVANSLTPLGYDLRWTCLRASDVGAPHRRERLFVLAYAAEQLGSAVSSGHDTGALDSAGFGAGNRDRAGDSSARVQLVRRSARCVCGHEADDHKGLPGWSTACIACLCNGFTAHASGYGWHEGRSESAGFVGGSDAALSGDGPLLPTPAVNDIGEGKTVEWWDLAIEAQRMAGDGPVNLLPTPAAQDGNGGGRYSSEGHQSTLPGEVRLLSTPCSRDFKDATASPGAVARNTPSLGAIDHYLPTPAAADGNRGQDLARANRAGSGGDDLVTLAVKADRDHQWGKYAPAIQRWEQVLGRPAPPPTEPNRNGNPRLNPEFSSWMMGWPAGWVTQVPGITRNDALRIIGNGVVDRCAEAALRWLLSIEVVA